MTSIGHQPSPACWKEKGVAGDASCPRLAEFGHCRNCPDYARAGRSLFDRDIPPGFQKEWAQRLADSKETESPGAISVVVFRLNDEFLALKTGVFLKAVETRPVHQVPFRTHRLFQGLVNVDGVLLPCVSAAELMGISTAESRQGPGDRPCYHRLMVVSREGARFVFPADEVLGVIRVWPDQLQPPPHTIIKSVTALTSHVFSWEAKTVGLMNDQKLLEAFQRSLSP